MAKTLPLIDCLRDHTDLHRRLTGSLPAESPAADAIWCAFARRIAGSEKLTVIRDAAIEFAVAAHEREAPSTSPYWPFRYDYESRDRSVKLHFGRLNFVPEPDPAGHGLLSHQRLPELRQRLAAMFAEISRKHPEAVDVRGQSWLYSRASYRRLYPSIFTATHEIAKGGFQGGSRWGQFHARNGVNADVRDAFLSRLAQIDPSHLEAAFPIPTWSVRTSIAAFYSDFGIA